MDAVDSGLSNGDGTVMIRLRPYKKCDAARIAAWVRDEEVFHNWGGDRFGSYPVSPEVIDRKYTLENGDCEEPDNFYPWVAFDDEHGVAGHFIMRYLNGSNRIWRFGWVIVDPDIRGKGYGTQMLRAGLRYAFEILGAEKVTIGVFENNDSAHRCYQKVGFADRETVVRKPWNVIEMETDRASFNLL